MTDRWDDFDCTLAASLSELPPPEEDEPPPEDAEPPVVLVLQPDRARDRVMAVARTNASVFFISNSSISFHIRYGCAGCSYWTLLLYCIYLGQCNLFFGSPEYF